MPTSEDHPWADRPREEVHAGRELGANWAGIGGFWYPESSLGVCIKFPVRQQTPFASQSWKLEVQNQAVSGATCPLKPTGGNPSLPLPSCWWLVGESLEVCGLWPRHSSPGSVFM